MDYATARQFLIDQAQVSMGRPDAILPRLQQGKPPVPGQITSVLLALKVVFEALRGAEMLDRPLAAALHHLASESRRQFDRGQQQKISWPPLLDEDLGRIGAVVGSIFRDTWTDGSSQ